MTDKTHIACPLDGCGSSDGYTLYSDGHGWCFSCDKGYFPPEFEKTVDDYKVGKCGNFRGISQKTCDILGIVSRVDEGGKVLFREYTTLDPAVKMTRRVHDKKMRWDKPKNSKVPGMFFDHLFNAGSSHYVTVVEGAEDGAATFQMLNGGKTVHPVVALTSSSLSRPQLKEVYEYLSKFETVKLAIEDDKAGKKVKSVLSEMLPNKIREVSLTKHKDANDYLVENDAKEFKQAWENAAIFTPENIYHSEQDVFNILNDDETESYVPTPFPELNEMIRGVPINHVTLITAPEGIGKTEVLRAFEFECLQSKEPCAILHFEETRKTTYKGLACYKDWTNYRDPDKEHDTKEIAAAIKDLSDNYKNLFLFEFKNDPDVNTVMEQINYFVKVCGVKYIFIDPINHFDPVDDTTKVDFLDSLTKKVAVYVANNPVGVVWTAHTTDEGQTRNSRMIGKTCSIRIDLRRDLMSEDGTERNMTYFFVSKNRPYSKTGPAGCAFFDEDTFVVYSGWETKESKPYTETKQERIPF
jgi:twinkle protein